MTVDAKAIYSLNRYKLRNLCGRGDRERSERNQGKPVEVSPIEHRLIHIRRVAVPTNKEERVSDACESVSRQVTDWSEA